MGWQTLGQFQLTRDWQVSEPVVGRFFRVRHTVSPLLYHRGLIAQAFNGSQGIELFDTQKVFAKEEADIYEFNRPQGLADLANRRLAFRRYDNYSNPWTVEIEVLEGSENVASPSPTPNPTPTPTPTPTPNPGESYKELIVESQGQTTFAIPEMNGQATYPATVRFFRNGTQIPYDGQRFDLFLVNNNPKQYELVWYVNYEDDIDPPGPTVLKTTDLLDLFWAY